MAEDVKSVMTITFRDRVKVYEFLYYSMAADLASGSGFAFEVHGVIGDAFYLHKALFNRTKIDS